MLNTNDIEQMLAATRPAPLPAGVRDRVLQAARRASRERRIRAALAWAAAAVLVLAIGLFMAAGSRDRQLLAQFNRPRPAVPAPVEDLRREFRLPMIVLTGGPDHTAGLAGRTHTMENLMKGVRNGS